MRANRSTGTKPELILARALKAVGISYRKNCRGIPGTPDFCIRKYKLAVFVDGEFWQGRNWSENTHRIHSKQDFWHKKIERNIARDAKVTTVLQAAGWKVFRFWESDVRRNPGACALAVKRYLQSLNSYAASSVEDIYLAAEDEAPYGLDE